MTEIKFVKSELCHKFEWSPKDNHYKLHIGEDIEIYGEWLDNGEFKITLFARREFMNEEQVKWFLELLELNLLDAFKEKYSDD